MGRRRRGLNHGPALELMPARREGKDQRSSTPPTAPSVVWTRSHRQRRAPLTRQAIVTSAVSLADREGLGAVSIRRIAAELEARPMSIYSFAAIEHKDELFDLMIDEVSEELVLPELSQNWREALLAIALRLRSVLLRHTWWIDLIGRNVLIGPNGIRYREQTLAALDDLEIDGTLKLAVLVAVETYVVGQTAFAIDEQGATHSEGRTHEQWQLARESYQRALIETGNFPHIARLEAFKPTSPEDRDRFFTLGLEWLLAGISTALDPATTTGP
jgi:AcrR family transcriptional regulator